MGVAALRGMWDVKIQYVQRYELDGVCVALLIHLIAVDLLRYIQYVQRYELDAACVCSADPPHRQAVDLLWQRRGDHSFTAIFEPIDSAANYDAEFA